MAIDAPPAEQRRERLREQRLALPDQPGVYLFRDARGRVVYVGITSEPVTLNDPLFHRRELTLLATRNAVAGDFTRILQLIREGRIQTQPWISHRVPFTDLPSIVPTLLAPESGMVKAVVHL